jgi:hypothetical protein
MGVEMQFFGHKADQNPLGPMLYINDVQLGGGAKWLRDLIAQHTRHSLEVPGGQLHPAFVAAIADELCMAALLNPTEERLSLAALIFQTAKARRWRAEVFF